MNSVDSRPPFFPRTRSSESKINQVRSKTLQRNSQERANEIKHNTKDHANVKINDAIKDFSRIKKAVDAAEPVSREDKIAELKAKVKSGNYEVDYDALADKLLAYEA